MADTNALIGTTLKTYPISYYGYGTASSTLDASGDKTSCIFQAPAACDLTGAMAYFQSVASPPTYKYTLQGVDASGDPDGSVLATTAEFTPSATTEQHDFTSAYTASQGQLLALVVEYGSGTISASNDATVRDRVTYSKYQIFPYQTFYNGSSWSADTDGYPTISVQTDQDWDTGGIFNIYTLSSYGPVAGSGLRYANRMEIPDGEDIELHINGFLFAGRILLDSSAPADGSYKAGVWNEAGAELASVVIDPDQAATFPSSYWTSYTTQVTFTSDATVTDGSVFYIGFEYEDTNLQISYSQPGGAAGLKSWPGGDMFYASYWNGSSWADDNTKRLLLSPTLSSWHGTASGGGSSIPGPSMGVIG